MKILQHPGCSLNGSNDFSIWKAYPRYRVADSVINSSSLSELDASMTLESPWSELACKGVKCLCGLSQTVWVVMLNFSYCLVLVKTNVKFTWSIRVHHMLQTGNYTKHGLRSFTSSIVLRLFNYGKGRHKCNFLCCLNNRPIPQFRT